MPLLKLQLNKFNRKNNNRALGAKEAVSNEDSTWDYEIILQHTNIKFIEGNKYWVGRTVMFPFLIIA